MKNTKLTPEQKQMEREYRRMQSVIDHAVKGQQSIKVLSDSVDYVEFQKAAYATYQSHIDAAKTRMMQLEEIAREATG
jgi:hypothetical protein